MAKTQPCAAQVIRSTRGRSACPERDKPWVLAAAVLGSTMAFVDESVVNVALPTIEADLDRKSTRLNSSHLVISYAVFCLKKKNNVVRICIAVVVISRRELMMAALSRYVTRLSECPDCHKNVNFQLQNVDTDNQEGLIVLP